MFRSSLATLASGSCAGFFVGTVNGASAFDTALAGFGAALLVAATDYLARRRERARHEQLFLNEHELTRAEFIKYARRRQRRKQKKAKVKHHG